MRWIKQGLVFCPQGEHDWMHSYAANPVVEHIEGSLHRVYFSCRDRENRSSIGFFDVDLRFPQTIVSLSSQPVLSPGAPGYFDDSGASVACLVGLGNQKYLYYTGWNLAVTVPWRNSIGLAVSAGGDDRFQKYSPAPICDRSAVDPFSVSYPWVMYTGSRWKMWYGSNLSWGTAHRDMQHVIKYAESHDGIHWDRQGSIAIPLLGTEEWGVARPCVIKDNDLYRMWYSSRFGETYRIGYAESQDGITWIRKDDEAGIDVSASGWDSQMIEYACVFDFDGDRYMFYNGNGFGKSGMGLAILERW
jgi:hypothetical protein